MGDTFDVYSDHVSTSEKLDMSITNRHIICVRDENVFWYVLGLYELYVVVRYAE